MEMRNLNVNIGQYSWEIWLICWGSGKSKPVGIMRSSNQFFPFATSRAWNCTNNWPWGFLKDNWVSRIVLTIREFLWTFWEKIFKLSQIIVSYHSWWNKLTLSCFHRSWYISSNAICSWTCASRTNTNWSLLSSCLDNWNIWMCVDMVCLASFPDVVGLSSCWLCNTNQIHDDSLIYAVHYI